MARKPRREQQSSEPIASNAEQTGIIAWMVNNRVTPNLLMIMLILGGLFMSTKIKREVFPEFELNTVTISVAYPGSSPEEVEQGIVLAVEEAIRGIDGIKEINATAGEGSAYIRAELRDDADSQKVFQDIQQEVDRITTFPVDAEDPVISLDAIKRQVLRLNLFGDVPERALREVVEQVRDRLLQTKGITQVDLSQWPGLRNRSGRAAGKFAEIPSDPGRDSQDN